MDKVKNAKYFTKMDIRLGYNNIRIHEGDEWKAAFKTKFGLLEPLVMFFGLCNSPATFQHMMDNCAYLSLLPNETMKFTIGNSCNYLHIMGLVTLCPRIPS